MGTAGMPPDPTLFRTLVCTLDEEWWNVLQDTIGFCIQWLLSKPPEGGR